MLILFNPNAASQGTAPVASPDIPIWRISTAIISISTANFPPSAFNATKADETEAHMTPNGWYIVGSGEAMETSALDQSAFLTRIQGR